LILPSTPSSSLGTFRVAWRFSPFFSFLTPSVGMYGSTASLFSSVCSLYEAFLWCQACFSPPCLNPMLPSEVICSLPDPYCFPRLPVFSISNACLLYFLVPRLTFLRRGCFSLPNLILIVALPFLSLALFPRLSFYPPPCLPPTADLLPAHGGFAHPTRPFGGMLPSKMLLFPNSCPTQFTALAGRSHPRIQIYFCLCAPRWPFLVHPGLAILLSPPLPPMPFFSVFILKPRVFLPAIFDSPGFPQAPSPFRLFGHRLDPLALILLLFLS